MLNCQTKKSFQTADLERELKSFQKNQSSIALSDLMNTYPIYNIKGNHYISIIAKVNNHLDWQKLSEAGIITGTKIKDILTLKVPLDKLEILASTQGILYYEVAEKTSPDLDKAIKDTRVDSVWKAIELPSVFNGKDVLIGICDWGFDYTNPNFYDTTLTHTRIIKAWDQYRNNGPAPTGFSYGTEISGETDLLNAQCDTFNIYQWATHGSHVAGICGGSGAGTVYRGVAYEANYLMATFLVDAGAVIDAYQWMYDYSQSVGKRLVINQSWGLYWNGNLDGTSILSQAIDDFSDLGVVFVSSGGNNGDVNFHLKKTFSSQADSLKTIVGFDSYSSYANMWGQSITLWGSPNYGFQFSVKVLDATNQIVGASPIFSTDTSASYLEGTIIINTDTVFYKVNIDSANIFNDRPHAWLRVKNKKTAVYKIALFANAIGGTLNAWNVIELTNKVGNWGSAFSALSSGWTAGDFYCGIGEPSCTKSVISIAAHQSEYVLTNGNIIGGAMTTFSSYGPTYDGRMKPDISAPGNNVCSSVSSFTNQSLPSAVTSVSFNGRNYKFCRFSGTSMSSPMVTGIVALMLQANPNLTPEEIKNIIIQTAREDINTGNIPDSGSYRWGHGKIHAWRAVKSAYLGIDKASSESSLLIFPNPATDEIYVVSDENDLIRDLAIYDISGKQVISITNLQNHKIDISALDAGVYFVQAISDKKLYYTSKIVKK